MEPRVHQARNRDSGRTCLSLQRRDRSHASFDPSRPEGSSSVAEICSEIVADGRLVSDRGGSQRRSPGRGCATGQRKLDVATITWLQWLHSAFARVRWGSLARPVVAANRWFERTDANGCERSRAFAMQKVVGSSPIIRSESPANRAVASSA
jgi:hypothetical protein